LQRRKHLRNRSSGDAEAMGTPGLPGAALRWGGAEAARSRWGFACGERRPHRLARSCLPWRRPATTRSSASDQPAAADEHQGDEHPENRHVGARAPDPRVWLRSPRFFTPYRPTRTRQDLPCTSAGEPRTPVGSPVRAPRRSSAEVFSWHRRGEGKGNGRGGVVPVRAGPRQGVRSKAHRFVVAGRTGCTGSRSVVVIVGH
jgi:hypothetical protein